MTRRFLAVLAVLLLGLAAGPAPGHAHGDDDHAHDAGAAPQAPAEPRLAAEGSDVELVATAREHTLTLYLDRVATNTPVKGASIEVMGEGIPAASAKEVGEGVYALEADWVHEPGTKALTFTVTVDGAADLLAGLLVIPSPPSADRGEISWSALLLRPEFWLLAFTVGLGGFFLAFAFRPLRLPEDAAEEGRDTKSAPARRLRGAAEVVLILGLAAATLPDAARAHGDDDHGAIPVPPRTPAGAPMKLPTGEVFLPKSTQRLLHLRTAPAAMERTQSGAELVGTVIADPAHEGRVQAPMDGQIELAAGGVSYVGRKVEAGDILALLAPAMPVYERGTLAQVTADVAGKLRIAEQKLQRLTRISGDYIPQREIDDTRTEIESLRQQMSVLQPKNTERMELKAPVSGIISVANVRAGQVVSARDTLFEIVDPKRLWIEAIGIAGTDDEAPVAAATALDAEGHRIPLSYVGRAPALRQQALPLLFRVDEPHASLGIGATVKVLVQHGTPVEGIVVPDAAIVRAASGLAQVWIKVAPERFAPRPVRTAPLDGGRVLVTGGLAAGDRVVVEAAELINQVR